MSEEKVLNIGHVAYGNKPGPKHPQREHGFGCGTGHDAKIGNLDKSLWKAPEFKGHMTSFPFVGWGSVDEEGRMPPGQKPFGKLPPGVTPAVSPLDRERMRFYGDVHTMSDGSFPANSVYAWRIWENVNTAYARYLAWLPGKLRETYNQCNLFDTQPRYHIRQPPVRPIWECHVNDVWCTAHADRRALMERRLDHNIVKILANRLQICHRNATGEEYKYAAKQFAYEYFCGNLDEAVKEAEAAFELKWGKLPLRRPEYQIGKMAYFKQKNRYIEDRFRHRMMENVGASGDYDAFTASKQNPRVIEGMDRTVHYAKADNYYDVHEGWVVKWWRMTFGAYKDPTWDQQTFGHPKWSMDEALMKEAEKRKKMRDAAAEAE